MSSSTCLLLTNAIFCRVHCLIFVSCMCLQLAKAGSHVFTERNFKRRRACDVCRQNIDNPGAFCKGESASPSGRTAVPRTRATGANTHLDLTAMSSPWSVKFKEKKNKKQENWPCELTFPFSFFFFCCPCISVSFPGWNGTQGCEECPLPACVRSTMCSQGDTCDRLEVTYGCLMIKTHQIPSGAPVQVWQDNSQS